PDSSALLPPEDAPGCSDPPRCIPRQACPPFPRPFPPRTGRRPFLLLPTRLRPRRLSADLSAAPPRSRLPRRPHFPPRLPIPARPLPPLFSQLLFRRPLPPPFARLLFRRPLPPLFSRLLLRRPFPPPF